MLSGTSRVDRQFTRKSCSARISGTSVLRVADSTFSREYQQAVAEQRTFELEVYYPALNRWFLVLASPSADCHYFYFMDATERQRLERELHLRIEQLSAADRGKVEFLVQLAHQVRNTLTVLHNSFYLARHGREAAERAAVAGENAIAYLSGLMDDLLKLSRLTLGRVQPRKEQVDLARLAAQAAETALTLREGRGRNFNTSLPAEPLWVQADPEHLREAVLHLLENAVDNTRPGDHIWLSAERQNDDIVLRVEDDGAGISPAMLPHVFELFMRGDQASERSQTGLGAGLALVRSLVELQGGTVAACSEGRDQGSEFTLRLPAGSVAASTPVEPLSMPRGGSHILVVDNNGQVAHSLGQLVGSWGYDVRVVYDGLATLREVASWRPIVVLLDIGMPGMDGYEVTRQLRSQHGLKTPILIAMTGYCQEEDRQRAKEAGFDHYMVKPVPVDELKGLLDSAVARVRQDSPLPPV